MRPVILDIGAGSLYFARRLRWYNWRKQQLIFCGEPWWKGTLNSSRTKQLINENNCGIFRVVSRYNQFGFEDNSLDMVTMNAPHILMPPYGAENELMRCLKSGGIFFFSYPVEFALSSSLEKRFTLLSRRRFQSTSLINLSEVSGYPVHLPHIITPSRVMKYNIEESRLRKIPGYRNPMRMSYIYREMRLVNEYEIWQKP